DPDHDQLHSPEHHQADHDGRVARNGLAEQEGLDQDLYAEDQRGAGEEKPQQAREPQRRDGKRCEALDRQPEQRPDAPIATTMGAFFRFVVDSELAKPDPARETLEEAIALRHLPQGGGGAWREQAEIASIRWYLLARAPVYDGVETLAENAAQPG